MPDVDRSLEALRSPDAGDLPPVLVTALRTTRRRRHLAGAGVLLALIAGVAAAPTLLSPRPAPHGPLASDPALAAAPVASAASRVTLVSLTRDNRMLDPEHLSLPVFSAPASPRPLRASDSATWTGEVALR
jgi:hypothetical protein